MIFEVFTALKLSVLVFWIGLKMEKVCFFDRWYLPVSAKGVTAQKNVCVRERVQVCKIIVLRARKQVFVTRIVILP
jgi:hypothetical protein